MSISIENVIQLPGHKDAKELDKEVTELQRASKEINRSNRRIIKQTFNSDVLEIPERRIVPHKHTTRSVTRQQQHSKTGSGASVTPVVAKTSPTNQSDDTDDWDTMFDDNGECLDPKVINDLTATLNKVSIDSSPPKTNSKADAKILQSIEAKLSEEEYPHVLEVSNFPVEFKTPDILMVFAPYKESGFDIKWVDDTHALAVFSSKKIAAEILASGHPFMKLKPLKEATEESRTKAKRCSSSLQPYKKRPETCVALARRLVTGALGVRLETAQAEREAERKLLREARERKMLAAKQQKDAWES